VAYNYSNSALATTLNGDITDTATSLVVVSATGYPAAPFKIKIDTEIIVVNTKVGVTFSGLERGHEGSPNVAHSNTDEVIHVVTAEDVGGFGQGSWLAALFARPETVHADDDEFDDESIDVAWTQVTPSGTLNKTERLGVLSCEMYSISANDVIGLMKTCPTSTDLTIDVAFRKIGTGSYVMFGPMYARGLLTSDAIIWQMNYWNPAGLIFDLRSGTYAYIGSDHSSPGSTMHGGDGGTGILYQRLVYSQANGFKQFLSPDGVTWTNMGSGWTANPMGGMPTHFGMGFSTWGGSSQQVVSVEYFRVTEADLS